MTSPPSTDPNAAGQPESKRLTDEDFWTNFWAKVKLPDQISMDNSAPRCVARAFQAHAPAGNGRRLLEIGCAPGRWMIFAAKTLGYAVDGLEYLPDACVVTRKNLALCSVEGNVYQGDFFNHSLPLASYDAVLSVGFIEHFTDIDNVLARHVALIKPGGSLLLLVPNYRYFNWALARVTNRPLLEAHNLSVMSLPFFHSLTRFGLKEEWVGYVGGLVESDMFGFAERPEPRTLPERIGRMGWRIKCQAVDLALTASRQARRMFPLADHINSRWFSSSIVGVYTRPA